jgi:glycosyltransferase 2 family protein
LTSPDTVPDAADALPAKGRGAVATLGKLALIAAKLAVTAVLIWHLSNQVSFSEVTSKLAGFDQRYLVPIALIFLGHILVSGIRWGILTEPYGRRLSTSVLVSKSAISYFLNQILVGTIGGDAYRIVVMKRGGYTLYESASVVFIERLIIMMVLSVIVLATLPFLAQTSGQMSFYWLAAIGTIGGIIGLCLTVFLATRPRIEGTGLVRVVSILQSLSRFLLDGLRSFRAILITIGIFATSIVIFWLTALGLGFHAPFYIYLIAVPASILAAMLPISVGGWGPREFALASTIVASGGDRAEGIIVGATVGLLMIIVSMPGLLFVALEVFGPDENKQRPSSGQAA